MKIDSKTIAILQNFQTINPSILIHPGKELCTSATTKALLARAKITDNFPVSFGIFDISRFLSVVSLFNNPDFDFEDQQVIIRSGSKKIKYTYASPELIIAPPKKMITMPSVDVEFDIKAADLSDTIKGAQVLGSNEIVITGANKKLLISATSLKSPTSDVHDIELGETNKTFNVVINSDRLKMLPLDYHVQICKDGMAYFKTDNLEYWIACNAKI